MLTIAAAPESLATLAAPRRRLPTIAAALLVVIAGAISYANSLRGPFVYDDLLGVVNNPNIRHLARPWIAVWAPPESGKSGRPLVALSLAVNYAIGGLDRSATEGSAHPHARVQKPTISRSAGVE